MARAELTYYGHSAFKITLASGGILLIDPWLKNPAWDKGEKELAALERVDIIALTHGHFDHVGDAVEIAKRTRPKLLCTFDLATALRNALGFPGEGDDSSLVGHFGGEISALNGEVTARFVPAWHGAAIVPKEGAPPVYGGTPSGIVFSLRDGPTVYHTGDTDLFSDMALVSRFVEVDYMLVCMGDHFTMGPARAAEAIELVKPRVVVPIHFGTFPLLKGTPEMLRAEMAKRGSPAELHVMKPGEKLDMARL